MVFGVEPRGFWGAGLVFGVQLLVFGVPRLVFGVHVVFGVQHVGEI